MIQKGYYTNKKRKLVKSFIKTLARYDKRLTALYGKEFSQLIQESALMNYVELIPGIPYYKAKTYQAIILLNAKYPSLLI